MKTIEKDAPIAALPQTNSSAIVQMDPLVAMIERAARDPGIDLERMERLLQMKERAELRQAASDFNDAMALVQQELTPIARDSHNPQTHSKYASYYAVDKVIRPIYGKHGFRLSFDTADDGPEDHVRVVAILSKGGHIERYHYDSPITTTGIQGKAMMTLGHAKASGVSYAKRYLAGMIFNLSTGEDDDGNASGSLEAISQEQIAALIALADDVGADKEKFCKYLKVDSFADITVGNFKRACDALEAKRKAAK